MAANMVCAYYDRTVDGGAEFSGMECASAPGFDDSYNRYDVVRLNMQEFLSASHEVEGTLRLLQKGGVLRDLAREYHDLDLMTDAGLPFATADIYGQIGRKFVIVIDEWDCVMREKAYDHEAQRAYLDLLRLWLKDRPYVALCYMTGILPFKKYGTHSALNMFSEFSMLASDEMAPYMGFTEEEVESLCREWGRSLTECRAWYDGYRLYGTHGTEVEAYSPRSVVRSMETGNFQSYWTQTETFDALRRYIDMDMDGLHERVVRLVAGEAVEIDPRTYSNDMTTLNNADDVLTLLVHLGYLTFDVQARAAFVPNREVMGEFASSVSAGSGWGEVARSISDSEALLDALVSGDATAVAALAQIRERGYDRGLDGLAAGGDVVLCGIAYDPKAKTHSCVIERA